MMRRYLRMNKQYVTSGPSRELIFMLNVKFDAKPVTLLSTI